MVPADDQAMALPCTSVIVIMVLLNVAFTCATPEAMFLRSRRRTRVASLPILNPYPESAPAVPAPLLFSPSSACPRRARGRQALAYFFLPAIGFAGPLRVRALVWVRWPRTGRLRRCRNPR